MLNYEIKVLLFTFLTTLLLLPLLSAVANRIGLVDSPSDRKIHKGNVPVIGGLAIFCVSVIGSWYFQVPSVLMFLIVLGIPLVVLGLIDDYRHVQPRSRLLIQMVLSLGMIFIFDLRIQEVGSLLGAGSVSLSPVVSVLFTVFCVIGVINAVNMIDGIDGLAGSLVLLTLVALLFIAKPGGAGFSLALMLSGGLVAFLLYNLHAFGVHRRVFLGDTGSMFLGFALVWLFIQSSQPSADTETTLSPVAAGWLLGLPLMDAVSVMVSRIRLGFSPLAAGRDHAHHMLIDNGVSPRLTLVILASVQLVAVTFGLLVNEFPVLEMLAFWLFVAIVIGHHFLTPEFTKNYLKKEGLVATN